MTTFQAILLGDETDGVPRPPGFSFPRSADLVKYCIHALAAGVFGSLHRGNDPGVL